MSRVRATSVVAVAVAVAVGVAASGCSRLRVTEPDVFRTATPEARPGGRVVVGITAPQSVDPALVNDDAGRLVASLVCEPLIQLDPMTGRLARGAADALTVTGDGAGLTISLRKGVKFHNGKSLTAQDVVYALSRVARHDLASPNAAVLSPVAGWSAIHGAPDPTDDTEPEDRKLAGVNPISKHAFEVSLGERNAEFVRALSVTAAAPVPDKLADRDGGFNEQPVCIGPYRMTKPYQQGDAVIELHRFEDYYGRNEAYVRGGAGYPDVIEFRILPDRDAQVREFDAGVLDIAHVPSDQVAAVRASHGDAFVTAALPQVEFLAFPSGDPVLSERRAREVLSAALDRQRLVDDVFGGGRLPATRILPPTVPVDATGTCATAVPPAASSDDEVLAGFRAKPLKLYVNADFANRKMADAVAQQWRESLGVEVQVEALPWEQYLRRATGSDLFDGLFRESWEPAAPGPDGFLFPLFHSKSVGHTNFARFNSRDFDRRIDRVVRRETDEELRLLKYASLEEMVCNAVPVIPLTFGQEEYLVRSDRLGAASGVLFHRATGMPVLRELYVRGEAS